MPVATVLTIVAGVTGAMAGLLADRLAARWPAHLDGVVRPVDWRTPVVAGFGLVAAILLAQRLVDAPGWPGLVLAIVVLGLVIMFATDLDQRLLPDVLTYGLIAVALLAFAAGISPFLRDSGELAIAAVVALLIAGGVYLLSIPFGAGAIGIGDLKLLVGVGLLGGPFRLFLGLVSGAIAAAVVILVLVAARRITLRTYVPYGPFLIAGAVWAILAAT